MKKMKKINVEFVCKAYNSVRDKNAGRSFPYQKVVSLFKEAGLSTNLANKLAGCQDLLIKFNRPGQGRGKHVGYTFPYSPTYVGWFENWLYPPKKEPIPKNDTFESECVEFLKEQGYTLKKLVGFNEEAFKKDYPELWEKYLVYENI